MTVPTSPGVRQSPTDRMQMNFASATVLGLESSCDDTAAAVLRWSADGVEVLAERVSSQDEAHAPYGGVVPEIAARAHAERLDGLALHVMAEAELSFADLDAVAATAGPGLVGGVMVALCAGKGMALAAGKPFIAVNHLEGHALSPRLSDVVAFPYLALIVSGGHSQFVLVEDVGRYRRLGSTIDDAAGEAFDKTAKLMGLPHPGGPAVERLAAQGDAAAIALPRPFVGRAGCDFSFAGLKTAALRAWEGSDGAPQAQADLAASFQAAMAAIIANRAAQALAMAQDIAAIDALALVGGVASNQAIRAALRSVAEGAGVRLVAPPLKWCTDNAAMIALAGAERLARGLVDDWDVGARPRWPLDAEAAASAPASGGGRKGPKA